VTKEVTVGPWPEPSADKKKCVTSSTNSKQFNFFESNDSYKPPPAASKHNDPEVAFAFFGKPGAFRSSRRRDFQVASRPGRSREIKRPLDPGAVGTFEWASDPGGAGSFKRPPDEAVTKEGTVGP
jgi:hypothetical protein